ncbi:MAG: efflux RND transporter periplasmic adaptor subunit, partial [Pseudomonadota bacterium]
MDAWNRLPLALTALTVPVLLSACGEAPPPPEFPPTPVHVVSLAPERVIETREFAGRIEAISTIELRPRVGGYLVGVHFAEGAVVREGDLLFSIDAREYEAALAAAEADVARATSRLQVATIEFERNERLIKQNAVSRTRLDAARAEQQQARADLALSKARLKESALDVEFTRIRAPQRGRVGEAMIKAGNLVSPNATLLTTLVSVDPVHVRFDADEQTYLGWQALGAGPGSQA